MWVMVNFTQNQFIRIPIRDKRKNTLANEHIHLLKQTLLKIIYLLRFDFLL